jgi:phosphoenolpyruvate synthase/pyruvate phosphate dikinase
VTTPGEESKTEEGEFIVPGAAEAAERPLVSVGGKGATLARLRVAGIPVPDFFVITPAAFARHLVGNGIAWPGPDTGPAAAPEAMAAVRDEIETAPLPGPVAGAVLEAYGHLASFSAGEQVAVRSSGAEEDAAGSSFAGQFRSMLGVCGPRALLDAVRVCWASYLSHTAMSYRRVRRVPLGSGPSLALIVQQQVVSQKAGVVFTVHPLEPHAGISCIEANFGTGESVVGGLATPDAITFSRSTGTMLAARIASKRRMTVVSPQSPGSTLVDVEAGERTLPALSDTQAAQVFQMGLRIEGILGCPQDVEWAFDDRGLWVLQSRPLTGATREVDHNDH